MHALHPPDPRWMLAAVAALAVALVLTLIWAHPVNDISLSASAIHTAAPAIKPHTSDSAAVTHALTHPLAALALPVHSPFAGQLPQ